MKNVYLTIVSWIPVASEKAQRRLTVWPGYDSTSGSTFTRWPDAPEKNRERETLMWAVSFLPKLGEETRKGSRVIVVL